MAKIWRNRIIAGDRNFSECPARYTDDVLKLMKAEVEKGTLSAERFEELTGVAYDAD